jgi:hypothetical protein
MFVCSKRKPEELWKCVLPCVALKRTTKALDALLTYRLYPEKMKQQGASFMKSMITRIELQQFLGEHKDMRNRPRQGD